MALTNKERQSLYRQSNKILRTIELIDYLTKKGHGKKTLEQFNKELKEGYIEMKKLNLTKEKK